jgi:hypothetical protein
VTVSERENAPGPQVSIDQLRAAMEENDERDKMLAILAPGRHCPFGRK